MWMLRLKIKLDRSVHVDNPTYLTDAYFGAVDLHGGAH